jgi:hypothetical protein
MLPRISLRTEYAPCVMQLQRPTPAVAAVTGMGAVMFLGAARTALGRYREFSQPLGLDNAYFLQRTWQAAFLDAPQRTLLATESGAGVLAGRHTEPILSLFVPLIRIWPAMETLLVAQVFLLSLGAIGAYRIPRTLGLDRASACLLTGAWLLLPGLWAMGTLDFRSFVLAAPLAVCALAALLEGRLGWGAVLLLGTAACREECALLLLGFLPAIWWHHRPNAKAAQVLVATCGGWILLLVLATGTRWSFATPGEFLALVASSGVSGGNPLFFEGAGPGLWLALLAPLEAIPLLLNWLAANALSALLNARAAHVFAIAWAGLAWVQAAALKRLWSRTEPKLGSKRAMRLSWTIAAGLAVANGVATASQLFPPPALDAEAATWKLLDSAPDDAIVLTQSRFAPALAARPEIYVTEDWPDSDERILARCTFAALQPDHPWSASLEADGFLRAASSPSIWTWRRPGNSTAPGPALTPGD